MYWDINKEAVIILQMSEKIGVPVAALVSLLPAAAPAGSHVAEMSVKAEP